MTVKQLKKELEKYPENMDVFLAADRTADYSYSLVNSVRSEEITFAENPDFNGEDGAYAKDTVVIIEDE